MNKRQRAEEPLVKLANEYLRESVRKSYAMYYQIYVGVDVISRQAITFSVRAGKPFNRRHGFETKREQRGLIYDIRNAILGQLGDLLPCPEFEAVYFDDVLNIKEREFSGLFYNSLKDKRRLLSSVVTIEEIAKLHREEARPSFAYEWEKLETSQLY